MAELIQTIKNWIASLLESIKALFKKNDEPTSITEATEDFPDMPIDRPDKPGEIVCYYGCPNSNRVKKLQLEKKLYR